MKHLSSFLDIVHRSGLVEPDVLNLAFQECKSEEPNLDAERFSQMLIERKILTNWQSHHLLNGKYKGFIVGQHKILGLIGKGGHASVYLAEHLALKQNRVIKVLSRSQLKGKSSLLERFVREARATARLNHPNVIRCFDVVADSQLSYLVMEYCSGSDLERVIKSKKRLGLAACVDYTLQTAKGLAYTKRAGMIHRDIKPSNLLLTKGVVKILDLGLAMFESKDEDGSLTQTFEDNLGTTDYIAPEQAIDSHSVDFRADIYSLGCTLYHFIVGHAPFNEGTIVQRLARHQTVMPTPISEKRPECPQALQDICWKMLQKDPNDRYQSYEALIGDLQGLLQSQSRIPVPKSAAKAKQSRMVPAQTSSARVSSDGIVPAASSASQPDPFTLDVDTQPLSNHKVPTVVGETVESLDELASAVASAPVVGTSLGAVSGTTLPGPRRKVARKNAEEEAYQRFLRREKLKTLWVVVGVLVGVGISIGIMVAINSVEELKEQDKAPPSRHFERNEPSVPIVKPDEEKKPESENDPIASPDG